MSKYPNNLCGFCGAPGHTSNTCKATIAKSIGKPIGYANPDVLEKLKQGTLSIGFIHRMPFNTEYPGKSVAAVPLYVSFSHVYAGTPRTTKAKKLRQAYEEGKAFRQPEIDRLKAEIAELKRQLSEQQQKETA